MHDFADTVAALRELHDGHVCVALDNFCGQLTVPQLHTLRPDTVKLDRSFLTQLGADIESANAIRSITGMIRPLGVTVVAKGVNTPGAARGGDLAQLRRRAGRDHRARRRAPPISSSRVACSTRSVDARGAAVTESGTGLSDRSARRDQLGDEVVLTPASASARTAGTATRACTLRRSSFTCSSHARTWSSGSPTAAGSAGVPGCVRDARSITCGAGSAGTGASIGAGAATAGASATASRRRTVSRRRAGSAPARARWARCTSASSAAMISCSVRFGGLRELGRELLARRSARAVPGPPRRRRPGDADGRGARRRRPPPAGSWGPRRSRSARLGAPDLGRCARSGRIGRCAYTGHRGRVPF